ncbi:MAG: DNA polymerase III subunit alpha [Planctomycetota bacterium]
MTTSPPDFVHLNVRSHYSLLTSTCRLGGLVKAAAQDEQRALALTDAGNLFGAIEFYQECRRADVKPILGMSAFYAAVSRLEPSGADNPTHQLTLLAENNAGWENLKQLSSLAHVEGFHYRPRIDAEALSRHSEGLIALSGGLTSEISQHLLAARTEAAKAAAERFVEILGPDRFYLELMQTGYEPQDRVTRGLVELHRDLGTPVVATNDVHYLAPEDWIAHDVLLAIRESKTLNAPNRFRMGSRELYFKTRAKMAAQFSSLPDALSNTVAIAERCDVEIDFSTYHLPVFVAETGEEPDALFDRICREGAVERYGTVTPEITKRLEYEMGIIRKLGFVSYFLITWDFIREARKQGIPVGPGRGSAAGSIVAYCMRITDLDPLRYNLIFERFLNAARVTMPDIDIDFCGNRRDEIIDYVRDKYGRSNVSQIITFGTMASRGVIRDVGRALEVPLAEVDKLAKKIPQGPGASLQKALESDPELGELRDASPERKRLFEMALKLEGLARHSSIHAAGVVVADRPLVEHVPLARNGTEYTTQWQMTELEEVGLLKVDFLGLKTLTILNEAVRLIHEVTGTLVDLDHLDLADRPTFELMTRGDTLGVFQLESQGMRELLARLKPDSFEDVIAVLALYRPGPLGSGMVDMFVRRKHGEEETKYPHESLRQVLEETYGVIVYQEQVMRIANILADFSMNQADALRKAMGKKKPEVMAKFKEQFIEGAVNLKHKHNFAKEIFETMEYFAGYGFNKSHSAAYALLTYQTAYLKAHYPTEFLAANLTTESGNSDKIREFVDESKRMDIKIRPADVNTSRSYFTVEDGAVRFGLGAVKGVGARAAELVGEVRDQDGPYRSLDEFCDRLDPTCVNKTALEALAKAGAFDELGIHRRHAFETIDSAMRGAAQARDDRRKGQGLLFGARDAVAPPTEEPVSVEEWGEAERLANEKQALGFYFSGHPFEKRGKFYSRLAGQTSSDLRDIENGTEVQIAGMIAAVRIMQIKSGRNAGQKMARFALEDLDGVVSVTCFARTYATVKDIIEEDAIVFATGRVEGEGEERALLLDGIRAAEEVVLTEVHSLVVRLQAEQVRESLLEDITTAILESPGDQRLALEVIEGDAVHTVRAGPRFALRLTMDLLDRLADLVGAGGLAFTRR